MSPSRLPCVTVQPPHTDPHTLVHRRVLLAVRVVPSSLQIGRADVRQSSHVAAIVRPGQHVPARDSVG